MTRYINADEIKFSGESFVDNDNETYVRLADVKKVIKQTPTADVEEVKHGEWIEWYPPKEYIMTGEEMLYCCTNCDSKYSDVEGYRYCPFCGAFIDGGKTE